MLVGNKAVGDYLRGMKQIKCPHCGHWTHVDDDKCDICNSVLIDHHHEERKERETTERNSLPIIEITEEDSSITRLWKRPVQIAQLIFFSIISVIAAIASSTVH